jgi:hypothetical protein
MDEIEMPPMVNSPRWATIRRHFDIQSYGVNAWSADAGEDVIGEHDEVSGSAGQHEELYLVLSGHATFTVDGETVDGPSGTIVFVRDPETKRKAVAKEAGTRILAVGAKRGEAFTPSAWERSAPVFPLFANKEYEQARELLQDTHEQFPDDPAVLYNLACAESMSGRPDDALEHLRTACELRDEFRELAPRDGDLEPLRDDPRFAEIVGVA